MGFHVSKVILGDTDDVNEAMSGSILCLASIVYDLTKEKRYEEALSQVDLLMHSVFTYGKHLMGTSDNSNKEEELCSE